LFGMGGGFERPPLPSCAPLSGIVIERCLACWLEAWCCIAACAAI
jgi:hypothetical protein